MRISIKIASLILSIFLFSCDKYDSEILNGTDSVLIRQVFFDSELVYEYTYNGANQIVEEKSKWHYTKHNYNENKLISSDYYVDPGMFSSSSYMLDSAMNRKEWVNPSNTEKNSTMTYYYDDNNKLIKSSNYLGYSVYSYDSNNRISRRTFYHDQKESGYIDFLYDEKGNVIKRNHYYILDSGESELQTTTEYEFDNKHNPYKAFSSLMTPGLYTNINNITKEVYTLHFEVDQTIQKVQVTENVYDYNEKGYPIRKNGTVEYRY